MLWSASLDNAHLIGAGTRFWSACVIQKKVPQNLPELSGAITNLQRYVRHRCIHPESTLICVLCRHYPLLITGRFVRKIVKSHAPDAMRTGFASASLLLS